MNHVRWKREGRRGTLAPLNHVRWKRGGITYNSSKVEEKEKEWWWMERGGQGGGLGVWVPSLVPLNPRCNKLPNVYLRRIFNIMCTSSLITDLQLGAEQKYSLKGLFS